MNRCAGVVVMGFRVRVRSVRRRGQPTGHPPAGGGAGPAAHSLLTPFAAGPRTLRGFVDTELAALVLSGAAAPLIGATMGKGTASRIEEAARTLLRGSERNQGGSGIA